MKKYWFAILICICMILVAMILYNHLPEQIPIHFGIDGKIDNYGNKIHIFTFPSIVSILTAVFIITPHLDPRKENYQKFQKSYNAFINMFLLFMACCFGITIYSSFHPNAFNTSMFIIIALGLFISASGNMMPKFRWNYFIGIRCPWTLQDERVWFLTHRFAGKLWLISGLGIIITAFLPPELNMICFTMIIFTISLVPMIYAYRTFQKLKGENTHD